MAKVKPKEAFEQAWDGSIRSSVSIEAEISYPQFKGNRDFIDTCVRSNRALFAERKKIQRGLFEFLRGVLGRERELVDFLSGDAVGTIPLLLTGDLRQLHLVDNGHSSRQNAVSRALARRLSVQSSIQHHSVDVSDVSSQIDLPSVQTGVFAESGFALPNGNRMPSGQDQFGLNPSAFRSAHVVGATATFQDVLRIFTDTTSGRKLHVVETPFMGAPLSTNNWGDYLTDQLSPDSRWKLQDVDTLLEETGTMRATLELIGSSPSFHVHFLQCFGMLLPGQISLKLRFL
ncbi:MAG: hypothetical protein WC653_05060 [Candidatus Gracilibacteria bacterium]